MEQNTNNWPKVTLSHLHGEWTITRTVGQGGVMKGSAAFVETAPDTLAYSETGQNHLPDGTVLDFYQSYVYRNDNDGMHADFTDGRPFHTLEFENEKRAKARHLCGNDLYEGTYAFHDEDHFTLTWSVKGPKKDFVIQTKYNRQGSC